MIPVASGVESVCIDLVDGSQTVVTPGAKVLGPDGRALEPLEVVDVLSQPNGFIDLSTASQFRPEDAEELEPWQQVPEEPWHRAVLRIFSRGVARILIVTNELDPDA